MDAAAPPYEGGNTCRSPRRCAQKFSGMVMPMPEKGVVGRCFGESGVDAVVFDIADRDAEGGFGVAVDFTRVGDAPTLRFVM